MRLSGDNPCIIGLEIGIERCGLACSDPQGRSAFPLPSVITEPRDSLCTRIREALVDLTVNRIIIGLPAGLNGTEGPDVKTIREFGTALGREMGCPVDYLDQRYLGEASQHWPFPGPDPREASVIVLGKGHKPRIETGSRAAGEWTAAMILQSWLNRGNFL